MRKLLLLAAVAAVSGGFTDAAFAADPLIDSIDELLSEPARLVAEWEENRLVGLCVVIGIALCGAVIAIVQGMPKSTKIVSLMLGAMVSLLTAIGNLYLDFDHRQYKSLASQGRHALAEAKAKKSELAVIPPDDRAAREAKLQEIRLAAHGIIELPDRLKDRAPAGTRSGSAGGVFVTEAYAQEQTTRPPDWLKTLPRDEVNLYFIGYSDAREYVDARRLSAERAVEEAQGFLASQLEKAGDKSASHRESIAKYLTESARVVSTYSTYDATKKSYSAYTLLSLSKRVANFDLKAYSAKTGVQTGPEAGKAIQSAVRTENDYLANRVRVYMKEAGRAQENLTAADYGIYEDARALRRAGKPHEAAAKLKPLLAAKPDFYLGWYNLALAYDDARDVAAARAAYERAVALERQQKVGDASLYNSYGFFLYRNRDFPEAAAQLQHALQLAPDHPKARQTLTATKVALERQR